MKVELLGFEGCPNVEGAHGLLKDCMAALGLSQDITEVQVDTPERARLLAFPGSPTIRVNDADVDPPEHAIEGSLVCRTYRVGGRLQGLPDRAKVMAALQAAQEAESHTSGDGAVKSHCARSTAGPTAFTSASNRQADGTQRRAAWAAVGLGLMASACCWVPLALAGVGVAGVAAGAKVAWMRPWALGGLGLLVAGLVGWWVYRRVAGARVEDDCCAVAPRFPTLPVAVLALSFAGAWAAPRLIHLGSAVPSGPGAAAPAGSTFLVLSTPQFDCPPCAGTLPQTLAQTPGVASVQMDFDERETRIAFKPGADVEGILARWDQSLGFSGKVIQRKPWPVLRNSG